MTEWKALTIYLDAADYQQLEAEAKRIGVIPSAVAEDYIHVGLASNEEADAVRRRRIGLRALEHLATLRAELREAGYPSVDVVRVMQESREELEQRPDLPWLSS